MVDLNLNAVFWCNRAFGRRMLQAGRGSIINIGSMSGIIANKPQPQAHYNATKAAVHMLTKSLAAEWATRGVRVNAVAPTYIETEMTRPGMAIPDGTRRLARDDADAPGRPAARNRQRWSCSWLPMRPR